MDPELPRQLMDLPIEIVVKILLGLPVESLCSIRCVSKTLLNEVDSLSFVKHYTLSQIAGNNSHAAVQVPQFMCFARGGEEPCVPLQSLRYDGGTTLTIGKYAFSRLTSGPYRIDYWLCFVFYNLLCMAWEDGQCLLINPLLRQVLSLPTDDIKQLTKYGPNSQVSISWYGMGYDNITNTYKIVRVSSIHSKDIFFSTLGRLAHVLVLGTNSRREIPSVPPCSLNKYNVCAHGDMHWLIKRRERGVTKNHIISFDFKKEEFCWTPTPPTLQSLNKDSSLHLVSLRGSMAIVETFPSPEGGGMNVEIWVMKDYAKKEWAREYSINVDMHPQFELKYGTCREWEHGIFFNDLDDSLRFNDTIRYFVDLRSASVNLVACPLEAKQHTEILSYTGSLISLRDYGTLGYTDDPHEVTNIMATRN